jgi:predicted MFS family arabinose efflux permease
VSARRVAQLLALFGLYAILGTRIVGFSQTTAPSTTMLAELAGLTVVFLIAAIFIATRPVRAPLD